MFGNCHGRTVPYIFSKEEISILMKTFSNLFLPDGLRSKTLPIAIALLWSTGMGQNKVCNLMDNDVNLHKGLITIRETKFSKSIIIPLHETTIVELKFYFYNRNKLRKHFRDLHFLITTGSQKLKLRNFEYAFQLIRDNLLTNQKRKSTSSIFHRIYSNKSILF